MKKKDDVFFIQIQDPQEVRRNLLEASQQMVKGMKSYEKYKHIKGEKLRHLDRLKKTTDDIKMLIGKLRTYLPTVREKPDTSRGKTIPHATAISLEQLDKEIQKLEQELHMLK